MDEAGLTQRAQLSPDKMLIAASDGRCWLSDLERGSNLVELPVPAPENGSTAMTHALLEGAIFVGLNPEGKPNQDTSYTLPRYIKWLVGNYLFAAQTPPTFRRAAHRYTKMGRDDLAQFAEKKAREETGHHHLAHRDLEALGLPADTVIELIQPPSAQAFVEYFNRCVDSDAPVSSFGFSYCLERLSLLRDAAFIEKAREVCPIGVDATHFLRVHSATGSDGDHVPEQIEFIAGLDAPDRQHVTHAAFETAVLLGRQRALDGDLTDDEICRRLEHAGVDLAALGLPVSAR